MGCPSASHPVWALPLSIKAKLLTMSIMCHHAESAVEVAKEMLHLVERLAAVQDNVTRAEIAGELRKAADRIHRRHLNLVN